jgi:signal transduction histidine kinase
MEVNRAAAAVMNDNPQATARASAAGSRPRPRSAASTQPALPQPAAPLAVRPLHSLALQVPLLLVIALSLVVSAGAWGLRAIVLRSFERLEVANAELDLRRFANAINYEERRLGHQLAHAVAEADAVSAGSDGAFFDVLPLDPSVATSSSPQLACVFDGSGALVATDSDDPTGAVLQRVNPIDFCSDAESRPMIAKVIAGEKIAGLYEADGTFFLVAAGRLEPGSRYGEAGAGLLLARLFSSEEIGEIVQRMAINIDFWSMNTPNLDALEAAAGAALSLGAPFVVNRRSEAVLQVYWAFEGADGEPAFLARANVFRDLREIGDETVLLSALAMTGVGIATILFSLLLVRSLMVKRLTRLTGQLLAIRRDTLGGRRLRIDHGPLGQRDEISVLAGEFDTLLGELAATTRQLADVSYRAGRAEVTEGSLHNIGNALNSLLVSADAARAKLQSGDHANIAQATRELAEAGNLTARQGKLAQYASLATAESAKRFDALRADVERVILHVNRIEDILESQRRLESDRDLAVASALLPLVASAVRSLPDGTADNLVIRLDDSLALQPPVICIRSAVLQVLSNLLVNATEAVSQAVARPGVLTISASTVDVDGIGMVELALTDNGIGLEVDELVKIFQRYYTTKRGRGHGIGLHWSANVVANMGGHLFARSEGKGKGASLHLRLPTASSGVGSASPGG